MRILIASHTFRPNLGGIETTTEALADAFVAAGHEVCVITATPDRAGGAPADSTADSAADRTADRAAGTRRAYAVVRRPGLWALRRALSWCDVYWQNGLSLRLARALPLCPRPWVVTHQTWPGPATGRRTLRAAAKRQLSRLGRQVAISRAIAGALSGRVEIVPNPYREGLFGPPGFDPAPRRWEVGFVGRLVSDKGVDLLLEAFAALPPAQAHARLALVGDGSERAVLAARATRLGLAERVDFLGPLDGLALAETLRQFSVLAVPSRWPEPFGIVALEGLASGCALAVSDGGGLPEAAGPDQATFASGDAADLARTLTELLDDPERRRRAVEAGARHLAGFTTQAIATRYIEIFDSVRKGRA